jgi:hypothetical protein
MSDINIAEADASEDCDHTRRQHDLRDREEGTADLHPLSPVPVCIYFSKYFDFIDHSHR